MSLGERRDVLLLLGLVLIIVMGMFTSRQSQTFFSTSLKDGWESEVVELDELESPALSLDAVEDSQSSSLSSTEESPVVQARPIHPHVQRIRKSIRQNYEHFQRYAVFGNESVIDLTMHLPRVGDFVSSTGVAAAAAAASIGQAEGEEASNPSSRETAAKAETAPKKERMNVVLFYADDWTLKVLGALNPYVTTPHIDGMAAKGHLFTHNCVTTSICWISRGTLATGLYAAVHNHLRIGDEHLFDNSLFDWSDTLYPLLKRHGYYSGLVGKWHAPDPPRGTFDVYQNYYGSHWEQREGQLRHVTDWNGIDALRFLRKRPRTNDKNETLPFALTVSFFATHAQDYHIPSYSPMNESAFLFEDPSIVIPPVRTNTEEHWQAMPYFFRLPHERNEGRHRWKNRFDTPENYQKNIKDLYRMAHEVDMVVGKVIDELKVQDVYENTLLMFTTDNGNMHGEHGLAEKWFPQEESIKVPLVIQDPRMPHAARGKLNHEFTLSVDLAPTILAAADIPIPSYMQGRDMAELYLGANYKTQKIDYTNPDAYHKQIQAASDSWRKDFFYEWTQGEPINAIGHQGHHIPAVFALIRKDYKYFYWPQFKYEQLFHVENDPDEEFDLFPLVLNHTDATSYAAVAPKTEQTIPRTTTLEVLQFMKARYAFLKNYSQSGFPV